jgi:hypothetical protein
LELFHNIDNAMIMTSGSLVSVLIPVFNAAKYLRASVQSILSQTHYNLEVIVIDDGSTDSSMETIADIKDQRLHIITKKNGGRATALNLGLEKLSGDFYATHDADDISHPERIEHQVQCLLENPHLAAVFTGHDIIIDGKHLAPRFLPKNAEQCRLENEQFRMPAHDPTGMFRMSKVKNLRYEPTLRIGAGLDYILQLGELHPMMVLGECLYSYRIHAGAITRQNTLLRKQMVREVLKRACIRRGLDPGAHLSATKPATITKLSYREQETGLLPHFMESVLDLRRANRTREALETALACRQLHPWDPYYYKPLVYCLAPLTLIMYHRSRKAKLA